MKHRINRRSGGNGSGHKDGPEANASKRNPVTKKKSKLDEESVPERLTFQQACEFLSPRHEIPLLKHLKYALRAAGRVRRPFAEETAIGALVKAIVTFRRKSSSKKPKKARTLRSWIRTKIRYAMRNLAAQYPVSRVRDAVVEFKAQHNNCLPGLTELSNFSGIGAHQILNVWEEVAKELDIDPRTDPIWASLRARMEWSAYHEPEIEWANAEPVRRALKLMKSTDACLIILKEIACYSEEEILTKISLAHDVWQETRSVDAVDSCLDEFLKTPSPGLNCPWDFKLFAIKKRGQLALRQLRARKRFRKLF